MGPWATLSGMKELRITALGIMDKINIGEVFE